MYVEEPQIVDGAGRDDAQFVCEPKGARSNYWLNAILLEDETVRDAFIEKSNDSGIATRPAWEFMNRLTMLEHCPCGGLSNAESIAARLVNLPSGVRNS